MVPGRGKLFVRLTFLASTHALVAASPGGYVGKEACQTCHPAQSLSHAQTGHANALRVAPEGSPGHWAFGAGLKAITYVSQTGPEQYTEHGLSYYPERKAMGTTPGHANASGKTYRTLDPAATALRCFRCHSTGPLRLAKDSSAIEVSEQGVQCESCHGPGESHARRSGAPGTILNPKRMSSGELNNFCGSCHRQVEEVSDWSNSWNVRHEPAYLNQSACFRKSDGALSCLTCHDAHVPLSRAADTHDRRCAGCHAKPQHRALVAGQSCVACHMPQVRTSAELQFTNHWIGIYEKGRPLVPVRGTGPVAGQAAPANIVPPADPSSLRPVFEQALTDAAIRSGPGDSLVARRASDLGRFLRSAGDLEGSATALQQALAIDLSKAPAEVPAEQENLASVFSAQGRRAEAEELFRQAAEGPDPAVSARSWFMLASLNPGNAETYYAKALAAEERASGKDSPGVAIVLNNLALAYRLKNNNKAAEPLLRRALAIQRQELKPSHPATASTLNDLGSLLQSTGRLDEAERLEREALRILRRQLGPQTAELATACTNLADLLWTKGARAEAVGLYRKALTIDQFIYGAEHPEVAGDLTNLGLLLKETSQKTESERLLRRALAIIEKQMGTDSPEAVRARTNLSAVKP